MGKMKGFTLIELMIVIAIIGLLGALVMAAIGQRRVRDRDVKRLADFSQLQKALELALANAQLYPSAPAPIDLGDAAHDVLCGQGTVSHFTSDATPANCDAGKLYMGIVPRDPLSPAQEYVYRTYVDGSYCIQTTLEAGDIGNLNAGPVRADADAIVNGTCP